MEEKILKKLGEFDKRFDQIDTRFEQMDRSLADISEGITFITNTAVTKSDLAGVENRLTQRIEILEHRVLTEHSTRLDILEDNVRQIKTKLGMA